MGGGSGVVVVVVKLELKSGVGDIRMVCERAKLELGLT